MFTKNSHRSYRGQPLGVDQGGTRLCAACDDISFVNPLPVTVVWLPVDDGLLAVRRNSEPQISQLALPGGYIHCSGSWQQYFEEKLDHSAAEARSIFASPASQRLCGYAGEVERCGKLP